MEDTRIRPHELIKFMIVAFGLLVIQWLKLSMKRNHVRAKLKRGESSIGTWLTLPDPTAARLIAKTGFDWLTVELEHTPITFETAVQCFAAISGAGIVPLARVPWNTGENIKRDLDTGAW